MNFDIRVGCKFRVTATALALTSALGHSPSALSASNPTNNSPLPIKTSMYRQFDQYASAYHFYDVGVKVDKDIEFGLRPEFTIANAHFETSYFETTPLANAHRDKNESFEMLGTSIGVTRNNLASFLKDGSVGFESRYQFPTTKNDLHEAKTRGSFYNHVWASKRITPVFNLSYRAQSTICNQSQNGYSDSDGMMRQNLDTSAQQTVTISARISKSTTIAQAVSNSHRVYKSVPESQLEANSVRQAGLSTYVMVDVPDAGNFMIGAYNTFEDSSRATGFRAYDMDQTSFYVITTKSY